MQGVQLYVEVTDADILTTDEFIDRFEIDVERIPIGIESAPMQYNGSFGYSFLTLSFKVECFISHYFPDCEPDGCENHGNCTCFPGYTGQECDINIDECQEAPCPKNSVCVDGVNSFTCRCLEGFSGPNCTARGTDDCIAVNCTKRGRCADDGGNDTCVCETGEHCETKLRIAGM